MIKAIVFDFDGVCLDTESARYRSWNAIYSLYNCELPLDEWMKNIGRAKNISDPFELLEHCVGCRLNYTEVHDIHKKNEVEITNRMPFMPGFKERLMEAKALGISCAIASSSSHHWVDGHLKYRSIFHCFSTIICREDVEKHKPDPMPYTTALKKLGVQPEHAVAVEDSPLGVASARSAGMYVIAVPSPMTAAMDFSMAHRRVASLADISWGRLTDDLRKLNL